MPDDTKRGPIARTNTSIGVVACNVALTPSQTKRVAIMASDGFARACLPIYTAMDGDALFVLATGEQALDEPRPLMVSRIGMLAADCAARALTRGVYEARSIGALRSYHDSFG